MNLTTPVRYSAAACSITTYLLAALMYSPAPAAEQATAKYDAMTIVVGTAATEIEGRYAHLLSDRLRDATGIKPRITTEMSPTVQPSRLTVLLGTAERHPLLAEACRSRRIALPTVRRTPAPKDLCFARSPAPSNPRSWPSAPTSAACFTPWANCCGRSNHAAACLN